MTEVQGTWLTLRELSTHTGHSEPHLALDTCPDTAYNTFRVSYSDYRPLQTPLACG